MYLETAVVKKMIMSHHIEKGVQGRDKRGKREEGSLNYSLSHAQC